MGTEHFVGMALVLYLDRHAALRVTTFGENMQAQSSNIRP